MSNLIKAEFFRIKNSSHQLTAIIGLCILGVLLLFMNDTASDFTRQSFVSSAPMGMAIALMAIGVAVGKHYQNRTAFYEIMDGVSAHRIILSRICVYMPLMLCFYFIPVSVILIVLDVISDPFRFLSILLIIFLRLLIFTVCVCLTFKTGEGAVFPYVRFIVEMMPMMMITGEEIGISNDKLFSVLNWLPMFQCHSLGGEIDNTLIMKIIIGFLVEAAVMYALAYTSHQKKWLIKTTLT